MEQLIERVAKAPTQAKLGAVAVALVRVTALNYFVMSLPFGPSISDMNDRIDKAIAQQAKLDRDFIEKTAIANDLNRFRHERELLEQKLNEALAELPEEKNIDELLQQFEERAQKSGLEIVTIEPKPQQAAGFYAKLPIEMKVSGNYHEIATFFDALGRMRRIVNVSDIALDAPKTQGGKVIVAGRFLATTFMFVDPKAAKPKGSK